MKEINDEAVRSDKGDLKVLLGNLHNLPSVNYYLLYSDVSSVQLLV